MLNVCPIHAHAITFLGTLVLPTGVPWPDGLQTAVCLTLYRVLQV